jgi:outer membrane protein insertion porin family
MSLYNSGLVANTIVRRPLRPTWLLALLLLGACNVTKHLNVERGERLLAKNSIELKSTQRLRFSERDAVKGELATLYKQRPNRREFFDIFPTRLWLYYRYRNRTKRFARWINTRVAEPPSIYSDTLAQRTVRSMENYVRQRGYFDADATYFTEFAGRYRAKTKYTVDLGPLYTINSVSFGSRDSNIQRILLETLGESLLEPGGALDGRTFEAERQRITREVKNRGYAFFAPNYIAFTGDSTGTRTDVAVQVLLPADSSLHKTYRVGDVAVFSSLVPDYSSIRQDTTINGVYYATSERNFEVKPGQLAKSIFIRPGELYRQDDFDKTVRRLNGLGIFRFVSLRPALDTLEPDEIDVPISFAPNKRLPVGGEVVLNTSTSSLTGQLFGVSSSGFVRNLNLLGGAENYYTTVQYNVEFDIGRIDRPIYSQEWKLSNELFIPRFFDYLGLWGLAHRTRLWPFGRVLGKGLYGRLQSDGQARLALSYNYLDLTSFYVYNLFNGSFGYSLRTPTHQYSFDHVGIDVLQPRARPLFDTLVANNEFLRLSFGPQLFTGFLLRSFSYNFSQTPNRFGERWFFRLNSEVSGAEVLGANRLWNAITGQRDTFRIGDLSFSKYARFDVDGGYAREFFRGITGALRIGSGIVLPFGDTREAPYVKQFFVGGPSSLRAWRIRELGPGGFCEIDSATGLCRLESERRTAFYQAADFRFEFNAEVRFPIFWWFKGAVFLDGGNIWTLKPDPDRPNAELRWDSYRNIALGTGLGVRGDFGFFVLRFDLGLKLRRPFPDARGNYWIEDRIRHLKLRDFVPNLAVGYPF